MTKQKTLTPPPRLFSPRWWYLLYLVLWKGHE